MPSKAALSQPRRIMDAQQGIHKNLEKVVLKHFKNTYQKPIAEHTQTAFDLIRPRVDAALACGMSLFFDSCCGTAMSTRLIAVENPNALVIGIDRSKVRLGKEYNYEMPENMLLVQAECADFWHLAKGAGWRLEKHTILYPNPYPKSKHLKRRWHAHPAFPVLLELGGQLELRTNWGIYAEEFCLAFSVVKTLNKSCSVEVFQPDSAITLFEKKYHESAQKLYRCRISL